MDEAPPFHQRKSSIDRDGRREKIRVADVGGRFTRAKKVVYALLIVVYVLLPWIQIHGHPAVFIDILHRRFYLFGLTFNAQDFYLIFFLFTGGAFALFFITALVGRVWCGWACPQTVFLDGVFRKIERWIEGPRSQQILLKNQPWNAEKTFKFAIKHAIFLLVSLFIAHVFLSYFVSLKALFTFVTRDPKEHWIAFVWMLGLTGGIYVNYAWFREQLCLIVCPYGRIQSALIDDDSLVIGYDENRGEPRGKKSLLTRGDCIECRRCVDVCPTGIDIREGLQMECIGCAACVDACDAVMAKIDQRPGLIRYDSLNGFKGKVRRVLRPRVYLYLALLFLGLSVMTVVLRNRRPFEANVLRLAGAPYVMVDQVIRNQYYLHLSNKAPGDGVFRIETENPPSFKVLLPFEEIGLKSLEDRKIPFFIEVPSAEFQGEATLIFRITNLSNGQIVTTEVPFLGPLPKKEGK